MIYFLQGEKTRRIKIGFTTRLIRSRIMALQTGSPDKLRFVGACPGDERVERELHFTFREHHSHGEWFNEAPELTHHIKKHCIHDMDIAHDVDSLVASGEKTYEHLLTLDSKEIH